MSFLMLGLNITFVCVYIFNEAKTFSQYTQSVYIASAIMLFIFALFILILKVEKLFEHINHCELMLNLIVIISALKYSAARQNQSIWTKMD